MTIQWLSSLLLLWQRGKLPAQLAVYIEHMLIHAHGYVHPISTDESPPKRNKINAIESSLNISCENIRGSSSIVCCIDIIVHNELILIELRLA